VVPLPCPSRLHRRAPDGSLGGHAKRCYRRSLPHWLAIIQGFLRLATTGGWDMGLLPAQSSLKSLQQII
jgi:hypothetical protein